MVQRPTSAAVEPGGSLDPAPGGLRPCGFQPERSASRALRIVAVSGLLLTGMALLGHSAPGDLDLTFAGLSLVSVGANEMCHAVAPDGKIVLAGTSGRNIVISRRLANGDADNTFGGDGLVVVTNTQYPMVAKSVAVQADGKIVVAGSVDTLFTDFLVVRVTASGLPDPAFSGDGFIRTAISGSDDGAEKVLIQPDGRIVVVGSASVAGDWDFGVARYNVDGTLDDSFSGDGMTRFGFGGNDKCFDAALQADGKLVMVGGTEGIVLLDEDFAVARLHTNGSLDNSFDGDGKVSTGFGDFYDRALAVVIQPSDLRIVVVGGGGLLGPGRAARYYSSDGSLDGSFDGDGKLTLPITAYDAAVTPGGKIALIGIGGTVARALRLNSNGSFDPEFQGDGDVIIDNGVSEPPSLSLLPDGRVLTVVPKGADCWLRRYWADGDLDGGGRQAAAFDDATFPSGSQEIGHALAVQSDGRLVVAGQVGTSGNAEKDVALARFTSDGQLDMSFGIHGLTELDFSNDDVGKAVAIQPDGKIVVAGYEGVGNTNFLVARFNTNGTLDNTFGFFGYNVADFFGGADYGHAVALQPDGKIVVAGPVNSGGGIFVFGVARFTSTGVLDNSFSGDGKTIYAWSAPGHWATALVVQGGTRIVVAGFVDNDFALVGFDLNGNVDTTFGTSGQRRVNLGGNDYLYALAVAPNMWLYAAGTRESGGATDFALLEMDPYGRAPLCPIGGCGDSWPSGVLFRNWGASQEVVYALDVGSDGQIVAAGSVGTQWGWAQFSRASTTPTATGTVAFPGADAQPLGVKFVGANNLVMAGYHSFQNDRNMAVARFETITNPTMSVDEPTLTTASPRLAAPSPNPLIGGSTFAFELPRTQPVRLAVHDASGRQVRMLMDGELVAGRHHRLWDGTDDQGRSVAAGVYFARLVAGAEHASASIVVLR